MIKRLPRFAETQLQLFCAEHGALCQKVDEDESGWDYLIEFESQKHPGPADTHPPAKQAFVQVKSASRNVTKCRVKLSNGLRAAQSRQPWFIVLMVAEKKRPPVRVFVVHVWEEVIRQTLKAVRFAENAGKPLHKQNITIELNELEPSKNLIAWMHEKILECGPEYEREKQKLYESVGYEDGHGTGELTIEASSVEEFSRNMLGLGKGLTVKKFSFTPSRFGLSAPQPQIKLSDGTIHISPQPATTCELRFRSLHTSEQVVLLGEAYSTGLPGRKFEDQSFRFSAQFFEMIWSPKGNFHVTAQLDRTTKTDLKTIENYATIHSWMNLGPIDFQVWIKGSRMLAGHLNLAGKPTTDDWSDLTKAVKLLRMIAGQSETHIQVCLADIFASSGLSTFARVLDKVSFRLEFEPTEQTPKSVSSIVYYFSVNVGGHLFYSLIERKVTEDALIEGRRRITAGDPRGLETYTIKNPTEIELGAMQKDYEKHLARLEASEEPLGFGDLREFISKSAQENPDAS